MTNFVLDDPATMRVSSSSNPLASFNDEAENYNIDGREEQVKRHWRTSVVGETLSNGEWGQNHTTFTVMSYNVLADDLMKRHPELYNQPMHVLEWNQRWSRILKEIETYKPDILCCQEVQYNHFKSHFTPDLIALNFQGLYKKRTGDKEDGCAIFYKQDKFILEDFDGVEYRQPNVGTLDRDNIALLAKFRPITPRLRGTTQYKQRGEIREEKLNNEATNCDSFVVATTHLLYNPKRHDVRLAQMALLFAELDRFAYKSRRDLDISLPTTKQEYFYPCIVTGDFNLNPESPIFTSFVSNGQIVYEGLSSRLRGSLLPSYLGVTDSCQHLDIMLARCTSILQNNIASGQMSRREHQTTKLFKGGSNVILTHDIHR